VDTLARYARMLGLGRKTGVELEHEKEGLVPTSAWKLQRHRERWQDGETLSVAIGQGFNLTTPLQLTRMTAAVANGGRLYRPKLVSAVRDPEGRVLREFIPEPEGDLSSISPRTWRLLQESLVAAVHGERATGRSARLKDITVAGKTGTAQVVRLSQIEHLKDDEIPYQFRDHAWFTAYAPAEAPEVAITVLVEHGGGGGSVAAPLAKAVLEAYFSRQAGALPEPPPEPERRAAAD
jgi:penicillin-binding protein 2